MPNKLQLEVADDIANLFFSAKVLLTRIEIPEYLIQQQSSEKDYENSFVYDLSSSADTSFEYYLSNSPINSDFDVSHKQQQQQPIFNMPTPFNMLTRSAKRNMALNPSLPLAEIGDQCKRKLNDDVENEMEKIPIIKIKKKPKSSFAETSSTTVNGDVKSVNLPDTTLEPATVIRRQNKKKPFSKRITRTKGFYRKKNKTKSGTNTNCEVLLQPKFGLDESDNCPSQCESIVNFDVKNATTSSVTAEGGYFSAPDSTNNEPPPSIIASTQPCVEKPILNYTLEVKRKHKGRNPKSCCVEIIVLPPTEPLTPSKQAALAAVPKLKARGRGRPPKLFNIGDTLKPKSKPKKDKAPPKNSTEKPLRKAVPLNKKLTTKIDVPPSSPPSPRSSQAQEIVIPGKSMPILVSSEDVLGTPSALAVSSHQLCTTNMETSTETFLGFDTTLNVSKRKFDGSILDGTMSFKNYWCRIPLAKIKKIPRVLKVKVHSMLASQNKNQNGQKKVTSSPHNNNNSSIEKMVHAPLSTTTSSITEHHIAAADGTADSRITCGEAAKSTNTIDALNDWFPPDFDLSLNETNYTCTDMVLEDQYFPKNSSFASTPKQIQTIDNFMKTHQPQFETIDMQSTHHQTDEGGGSVPDFGFSATSFYNCTVPSNSLTTPVKLMVAPPPVAPVTVKRMVEVETQYSCRVVDDDAYTARGRVNKYCQVDIDVGTTPDYLSQTSVDDVFKRPIEKHPPWPTPVHLYETEPLDLSIRPAHSSSNSQIGSSQNTHVPALCYFSPQANDDEVLSLDASYQSLDLNSRCHTSERSENVPSSSLDSRREVITRPTREIHYSIFGNLDAMIVRGQDDGTVTSNTREDVAQQQNGENLFSELGKVEKICVFSSGDNQAPNMLFDSSMPGTSTTQPVEQLTSDMHTIYAPTVNFFEDHVLKRRVQKLFGFPCYRFLSGKCSLAQCKYNHSMVDATELQAALANEPIAVLDKCYYDWVIRYDGFFVKYFEIFCNAFGHRQMVKTLIDMIPHCEGPKRPIAYYRHVVHGLLLCKLDKVSCYAILIKNYRTQSLKAFDILIQIMLDLEVVLHFTNQLEIFLKHDGFFISIAHFNRLFAIGSQTKEAELIRILLETINRYPSDYQSRLNSNLLTEFLQMVRNLKRP